MLRHLVWFLSHNFQQLVLIWYSAVCGKCDSGRWPGKSILAGDPGFVFCGSEFRVSDYRHSTAIDYLYHKPARRADVRWICRGAEIAPISAGSERTFTLSFSSFFSISQTTAVFATRHSKSNPSELLGFLLLLYQLFIPSSGFVWDVFSHINYWIRIPGSEFTVYCAYGGGIYLTAIYGGWTLEQCQKS